jgi:hypothetical protein
LSVDASLEGVKQFVEIMFSYNEGRTKWN